MQMMKKVMCGFALCALITLPTYTNAQTVADLQAQVTALLARLSALQAQMNAVVPITPTSPTTDSVLSGGLTLSRDLKRGDTGADVSQLQTFLARNSNIYPEGLVTGSYFALTEAAVKRFQVACGIVSSGDYNSTGYGRVGPKTRTALQNGCGAGAGAPTSGVVGGFVRVSPNTGGAPLTITASVTVNTAHTCDYAAYALDFGDGTVPTQIIVPAGRCAVLDQTFVHTYQATGTYTVSLRVGSHYATTKVTVLSGTGSNVTTASNFSICINTLGSTIINTAPRQCTMNGVTYTETTTPATPPSPAGTLSANPTKGTVPLTAIFTATLNSNSSCSGGEYTLVFGDGQLVSLTHPANACAPSTVTVTHRYEAVGNYSAKLYAAKASSIGSVSPLTTASIEVNNTASTIPNPELTITPGFDGTLLQKVRATFKFPDSCVPFSLNWGDGSSPIVRTEGGTNCTANDQQSRVYTYPSQDSSKTYSVVLIYGPSANPSTRSASVTIVGAY